MNNELDVGIDELDEVDFQDNEISEHVNRVECKAEEFLGNIYYAYKDFAQNSYEEWS